MEKKRRPGLREIVRTCFKAKSPPKSTAERCKKYRDNMTEEQREQYLSDARARAHRTYHKPLTEEQLALRREKSRERSKKYREKKKLEQTPKMPPPPPKAKTRHGIEEQRRKWREEKRQQRQNWSGQKKRRHREKMLQSYYDKKVVTPSPKPGGTQTRPKMSPNSPSKLIIKNLNDELNTLKTKRSKESIKARRILLNLFDKTKSVKKNLYQRKKIKQSTAVAKQFILSSSISLPSKSKKPLYILQKKMIWLYKEFLTKFPEKKVSFSTFYRCKSKNVLTCHNKKFVQCLCEICVNVDLKLEALNKYLDKPIDGRDCLSDMTLCENFSLKCLERVCPHCGLDKLNLTFTVSMSTNVKWSAWDMVETKFGKRREQVFKETCLKDLFECLLEDTAPLSQHIFVYRWQLMQLKTVQANLTPGRAVALFDFAENYLCKYQNEVQSAHWGYNQVTIHPCVLYYKCGTCEEQITDYFMVMSDDLNHDAHFVKAVTDAVIEHLRGQIPQLHTLTIFSDGCAAQYKSKTPFWFLLNGPEDIDIRRCFFGSRHGKSPCDSSGGVIKGLVSCDVKTSTCIIQNAKSMHEHCSRFYQLPVLPSQSANACDLCHSHVKRSFHLISYVDREVVVNAKIVKGTRHLHEIRRFGGSLLKRNLSCFCKPCEDGNFSSCENKKFVNKWEATNVRMNKSKPSEKNQKEVHLPVLSDKSNLSSHDKEICKLLALNDRSIFFKAFQTLCLSISSVDQLKMVANLVQDKMSEFPLPLQELFIENMKCTVDKIACGLLPSSSPSNYFPLCTGADGNCLPRAISCLIYGVEDHHVEMRMRIFVTQLLNRDVFLDFNNWKTADVSASEVCTFLATVAEVVQQENNADIQTIFDLETISIVKDGSYMGLWQLFAFSYFTNCDVVSLYPELGWDNVRKHCHRRISPPRPNSIKNGPVFYILWSSNREDMPDEHWTSNHFVPLLPVGCAKPVELATCDAEVSFVPKIGSLYHIEWNGSIYVALVREIDLLERMAMVSFMAQRNALYYWPAKEDVSWEPMSSFQTEVHLALIESASSHRLQFYSVNL